MILNLTVRNIILIEKLDINFKKGLTVLTGETGAGKSIIIDCLTFLLGKRNGNGLLKYNTNHGYVEADFQISNFENVKDILSEEYDIKTNDLLNIRRTIAEDGKSKAFINDVSIGANTLKKIGELLIEIVGQHGQTMLFNNTSQREILDIYANMKTELFELSAIYQELQNKEKQLKEELALFEKIEKEKDYLEFVVKEVEALNVQKGEEDTLATKRIILMGKAKSLQTISNAIDEITDKNLISSIRSIEKTLIRSKIDNIDFSNVLCSLDRSASELDQAISALDEIFDRLNNDDKNLDLIEERLFAIKAIARKYNLPADLLPEFLEDNQRKLQKIANQEGNISSLSKNIKDLKTRFLSQAKDISTKRKNAAKELEAKVEKELKAMKMEKTIFHIKFEELEEDNWSPKGIDVVSFLASPNLNYPLASISKIASGGELSRFMLSLILAISSINPVPLIIFDEIDTGIGGSVADKVGRRLSTLGDAIQVIVVTHQPQVAAYARNHLFVEKKENKNTVSTTIRELDIDEREEELARMLAGEQITVEARAAAKSLIKLVEMEEVWD